MSICNYLSNNSGNIFGNALGCNSVTQILNTCSNYNVYYQDLDNDNFGNFNVSILDTLNPIGFVLNSDDTDLDVYYGSTTVKPINNGTWSNPENWKCTPPNSTITTIKIDKNINFNLSYAQYNSNLFIVPGYFLNINSGCTLELGSINNNVNLINNGAIYVNSGGTLIINGLLENGLTNTQLVNDGTLIIKN